MGRPPLDVGRATARRDLPRPRGRSGIDDRQRRTRPRSDPSSILGGSTLTDPYRCDWCDRRYVVPSLARDCEDNHMTEDVCEPSTDAPTPGAHV